MKHEIRHGDCVALLGSLAAGSVDLAFADPPFNIGFDYDVYRDDLDCNQYLDWSRQWIAGVHRALKPNGTFWLAIGDEYAAELKIISQKVGFTCRSWVIWYYTFGVNCERKFTRSHAHLFHFVKDPNDFVFRADEPENRIPSARQLVYNDRRANPHGRLPDDTWIIRPADALGELAADDEFLPRVESPRDPNHTWTLRPQDLEHCFRPEENTWYFPRVAGTFRERAGFHGCQMPEQLLGRIIRTCSEPGALVLDPFSGSGTTVAVAKKLGRQALGFDLSPDYVRLGRERLASVRVGDPLDGSPEPTLSAPPTAVGRRGQKALEARRAASAEEREHARAAARLMAETEAGVLAAFQAMHDGHSADRLVADPNLNGRFLQACEERGLAGEARAWNMLLFRLRKTGRMASFPTQRRTAISWQDCDPFLFASEIAWQMLKDAGRARSLDEILCDPVLAAEFDAQAARLAPGFSPLEYRWAALKLRKQNKVARTRAALLRRPKSFGPGVPLDEFDPAAAPEGAGVYLLRPDPKRALYVGEAIDLRSRLQLQFAAERRPLWQEQARRCGASSGRLLVQVYPIPARAGEILAWQRRLVDDLRPRLNLQDVSGRTRRLDARPG